MTDGANAPGSLRGSPGAAPDVVEQISERLGYSADRTVQWIEACLDGRQVSNVDAYLLQCLNNHLADAAKAKAARNGAAPKPAKKPPTSKASGKTAKKTAGKHVCPDCGRDFKSTRSLATHKSHHATVQCPVCDRTVKARDQADHHRIHRAEFVRSIQDQPPCAHGVPGGNLAQPNGLTAEWRPCDRCRIDRLRERWPAQSSTPAQPAQATAPRPAPVTAPTKPKPAPKPCQRCGRPLTGWDAVKVGALCPSCTRSLWPQGIQS